MAFFSGSLLFDLFILLSIAFLSVYSVFAYVFQRWTRRGIPHSNVHPIFGNLTDVILGRKAFPDLIRDFHLQHKHLPFIAFFSFTQPSIMINDIELVKSVFIKDFSSFSDRNFAAGDADPMEKHNMFTMKGNDWRNLRMKLTPTFTSGKLRKIYECIDLCGKSLLECLEVEAGKNGEVEIKDVFGRFTTDIIASTAFGIEANSLKDPESGFRKMLKKSTDLNFMQNIIGGIMFLVPKLAQALNLRLTNPEVTEYLRRTVWDTVEYREKSNVTRNDFLSLLMRLRKEGSLKDDDEAEDGGVEESKNAKIDLEGDKFVAQCFLFLVAGFETSSSTMSYALYELAKNKSIQTQAYEEIKSIVDKYDGKVTYEGVQEMKYLDMIVHETLRKYPLLVALDRRVTRPFRLPGSGIELAPGDTVLVPVVGLHHDPALYPAPHAFDPARFEEAARRARPACAFLGFGDGPRSCIGMRLGLLQSKVGLIYTLLKYEVSPTPKTPKKLEFAGNVFVTLKGGIPLKFEERTA